MTGRGSGDLVVFHPARADDIAARLAVAGAGGRAWPGRAVVVCRDAEAVAAAVMGAEVVCATNAGFPAAELLRAPRLRWVHGLGAGVDRLLSVDVPPRVVFTRSAGIHGLAMAEYAIGHIMAFAQDIPRGLRHKAERAWRRYPVRQVAGARLGVAGLGLIGREVARLGRGLGMEVWGLARRSRPRRWASRVCDRREMTTFLSGLDFLVVCLPLTPETRGMIGAGELGAMKATAVLVNMGRGPVVDEAALVDALRRCVIAGAALDVFEREPLPAASPLWDMPNVLITPHMAGQGDVGAAAGFFADNLRRYLSGRPLLGRVDRRRGY